MARSIAVVMAVVLLLASGAWAQTPDSPEVIAAVPVEEPVSDWESAIVGQGGFVFDFKTGESQPYIAPEFTTYKKVSVIAGATLDIDEETEKKGFDDLLVGLTVPVTSLDKLGGGVSWAKYINANAGLCGRYDFDTQEWSVGVVLSVVAKE